MKNICAELDIDYEEIKDKLPDLDEAANETVNAQSALNEVVVNEPTTEGSSTAVSE